MEHSPDVSTSKTQARPARTPGAGHPLGPLLSRRRHSQPGRIRLLAAAVSLGCWVVLGMSMWLKPDPRGIGTHEQFGLPPCSLVQTAGIPCPTCGMTTAFAYTVRGRWVAAFLSQPFAFVLAVATMLAALLCAEMVLSGKTWRINWYRLSPNRMMLTGVIFFALAWVYKIIVHLAQGP